VCVCLYEILFISNSLLINLRTLMYVDLILVWISIY